MKSGYAAQLLIVLSLINIVPVVMAMQEQLPKESTGEAVVTEQTEPQPKLESKPVIPVTGSRGQLLYENHCQTCHTSIVHVRETHRSRSLKDLMYWVTRWSSELKLQWSADEIGDVVDYLNRRYYKFEMPPKLPH